MYRRRKVTQIVLNLYAEPRTARVRSLALSLLGTGQEGFMPRKNKVEKVMGEFKDGTLKSGSGQKVTNPKQAIAIGLSEARKAGGKTPKKKSKS